MAGTAFLGRRSRVGLARWITELLQVPVYWDGEDIREPDQPYCALRDMALKTSMTLDAVFAPMLSFDLEFAPTLGIDGIYTLDIGTTPLDVAVLAADTAAELPARVSTAWGLSGFGLDGWTFTPLDNTHYRLAAPAEIGGVLGLDLGWGWTITAQSQAAAAYEYTQDVYAWDVEVTFWGAVRGRGTSLRALARLGTAASSDVDTHRLRLYTGLLPGHMDPIQPRGRHAAAAGVAGVADIAQRVCRFMPSFVFSHSVPVLAGIEVETATINETEAG